MESVLEAAASLTVEDFRFLVEEGLISIEGKTDPEIEHERELSPSVSNREARRKVNWRSARKSKVHEWPPVGTHLYAAYDGMMYEAVVRRSVHYKSGRSIEVSCGPAKGTVCPSMSGAMMEATKQYREEFGLGNKGMANGWEFWEEDQQQVALEVTEQAMNKKT